MNEFNITPTTLSPRYKRKKHHSLVKFLLFLLGTTSLITSCLGPTAGDQAMESSSSGSTLSSSETIESSQD